MLLSPLQVNEFVASRSHGNVLFRMVEGEEGRPAARLQRGQMMEGSVGRERESGLRWMLARVR